MAVVQVVVIVDKARSHGGAFGGSASQISLSTINCVISINFF